MACPQCQPDHQATAGVWTLYLCPLCGRSWHKSGGKPIHTCTGDGRGRHVATTMEPVEVVRKERLDDVLATPDWGEQYLRSEDERKRQGDRAHKWQRRAEDFRAFVEKMWLELDDAADAVGPVPDIVERNLRAWHREAERLLKSAASDEKGQTS